MSCACAPILVGVTFSVPEILLPSKTANFPFPTMDYSPWSSKNLIDRNWLKKFMQVGIDVTCTHTNFGGRSLSGFGDSYPLHIHLVNYNTKLTNIKAIHFDEESVIIATTIHVQLPFITDTRVSITS